MIDAPLRPDDAPPSLYGPDGEPQFFSDPAMDRFVAVVLNLTSELWVQAEQIATLREIVEQHGLASAADLAALAARAGAEPAREVALRAFIERVLTPLRERPRG